MNSHRPFQETYYQQRVLSSLRFAVIAAFLVRGLLHHRLTMQRSQLSAHYANNFAKKNTQKSPGLSTRAKYEMPLTIF